MRKSIMMAAALTVGGGASLVGAQSVPNPYVGSDTLTHVSEDSLNTISSGLGNNYLPGGSGAGQNLMIFNPFLNAPQETAPMSKMMTGKSANGVISGASLNGILGNGTCSAFGGSNGTKAVGANGIVIGLDAVDILSSDLTGGSSSCNSESNTPGMGLASDTSGTTAWSSIFTGNGVVNSSVTYTPSWKWVLALLYGGLDYSNPNTLADCNSTARQTLVQNWANLFEDATACGTAFSSTSGNLAGVCGDANHNINGQNVLWHAFRRDDGAGTADVFSTLLGITSQYPSTSFSNLYGFGQSPFCNAMNWDVNVANNGVANGGPSCNLGVDDQFVGPGGVIDPNSQCTFSGFQAKFLSVAETCSGGGNHRQPPPGTWGLAPQTTSTGGPLGTYSNFDVLPTSYQDNDPIRRPCIGGSTGNVLREAEEVCNLDGKLGVVLSIPASDFITDSRVTGETGLSQYPTTACGNYTFTNPVAVFNCAPFKINGTTHLPVTHAGECPDGDGAVGTGCLMPVSSAGGQCLAIKGSSPSVWGRAGGVPANFDGRSFNLAMFDNAATPTMIQQQVYEGKSYTLGTATTQYNLPLPFFGGMGRIHSVATIWNDGHEGSASSAFKLSAPPNIGCQEAIVDDQIGCLTQADPCSVGFAGDGSKTWAERLPSTVCSNIQAQLTAAGNSASLPAVCGENQQNGIGNQVANNFPTVDSLQVQNVYATVTTVDALGSQTTQYPMARKIYFNSGVGFANLSPTLGISSATLGTEAADTSANIAGELALAQFEYSGSTITSILGADGFFPIADSAFSSPPAWASGPFCEDFNEQMLCGATGTTLTSSENPTYNPTTDNINGCTATDAVNSGTACTSSNCPSASGTNGGVIASNSTVNLPTAGSICGNGIVEPFEECDLGASLNSGSNQNCSNACRCANGLAFRSVNGTYECN
jgi:hypothetical protein